MSKIFEALNRKPDVISGIELDPLLEGETERNQTPPPKPPSPPALAPRPQAVAPAVAVVSEPEFVLEPSVEILSDVRTVSLRVPPTAPILPFDGSHWRAGEQYRILRTKLIQHLKKPQILVVTSSGPNDGKSVNAVNLAGAMALKGEARVLLIDGDFRRSTIHNLLGITNQPGLAEVLRGECPLNDATVRAQQIPNLYILPGGKTSTNPAELLDSSKWDVLVAACRAQFQYVVIDSSPIGPVADYELIQAVCDGVILVIRPDHTDRQACMKTLKAISKDKFLGVVLNCVQGWLMDNEHTYSSYYYHYGERNEVTASGAK